MPHLERQALLWSLEHITTHGDTDIFPYPFEFEFLMEKKEEIVTALASENTATFRPLSSLDSLVPKSRHGFRVAHQLYPTDAIFLLAATFSIGAQIEAVRGDADRPGFSYKFEPNEEFSMFATDNRFGNWLLKQYVHTVFTEQQYTHVVEADISDFYQRIYHHRLENGLLEAAGDITETRLIRSFLRDIRARQSFGIPVGGNATRLLAELSLVDIDRALLGEGYEFTRYVDDFRIFIKPDQDPYNALAFLADNLWSSEGLSLASAKTRVISFQQYREQLELSSGEDATQAEASAAERLLSALYDAEESDIPPEDLVNIDLVAEIYAETGKDFWDLGKIRILLRCMKLTRDANAADFLKENYSILMPFAKEMVLLMEELSLEENISFQDMEVSIVDLILTPAIRHLHVTRAWLLELFVRGVISISAAQARRLDVLSETLDQRAIFQIRALLGEVHYFRQRKARINELTPWLQPAFLYSAACLPAEEYRTWLGNIKQSLSFPLANLFVDWARSRR
ncbi:RNA-directed DNA polymerase [Ochrobactrum quorumnocens]|uniref:RNA-directed DNA polymerase n=1 Tax=Ochrobactrum quorumnocens TaxID=271865 RepID=A0A5N1JS09_9HYPH|nr:RNA-directed DNA polymerase [[Ochrobactrum] quorumnocens]KAA9366150.1 RNA-directed DNA polymerase [[Ochrobactrum] quorumnocens]